MGRKIIFASSKGGVGKSTIITNVADVAAQLGEKVVLLDADISMADLALYLGLDIEGPTLHELLAGEAELDDAIYSGPDGLKIIPAGVSLEGVKKSNPKRVKSIVDQLSERFDLVLIDPPAGLGSIALSAFRSSEELLLITEPMLTSLSDAMRTKDIAMRLDVEPKGVIISRFTESGVDISEDKIESVLDLPVIGKIPEDSKVQSSSSIGDPVVKRSPDSPSAKAFRDLAWKIFVEMGGIDYQELSEKTISEIKEIDMSENLNPRVLLEVEKKNKDRKTLKDWLRKKIKESEDS